MSRDSRTQRPRGRVTLVSDELFDAFAAFDIIEESPCERECHEYRRPADDLRVEMHDLLHVHVAKEYLG